MKKRKIYAELMKQKNDRKITFLLGARQVGKTTLLRALYEEICVRGKKKGMFLDLDIFSNFEKISSFENLVNLIKLNEYEDNQKEFFYLFLDEFQRYENVSMIMKNVYDNLKNIKIYASGSSSLKIKSQIQESLAGRKKINNVYPLDFEEFLCFKEDEGVLKQFNNAYKVKGANMHKLMPRLNKLFEEFMVFGGYPEVTLKNNPKDKIEVLESIFDLYIKKDLIEYLNIKKIINVKKLIEFLAINNGQKIKYEEICQISQLSFAEVKNYIEIIKETYIISILKPFFTNKNKELSKIPKIYFMDNGVRNFFINNFNSVGLRDDRGFLFEGCIISELIKSGINPEYIKFWQDKHKHEVDVLVESAGKQIIPIEIKFKNILKNEDIIGIKAFMEEYSNKRGYIINIGIQEKKGRIYFKLPFKFLKGII